MQPTHPNQTRRYWGIRVLIAFTTLAMLIVLASFIFGRSAIASEFSDRSVMIDSPVAGQTTQYAFTFGYTSPAPVGSVKFQFCDMPLPLDPCVTPAGLDVQNAVLTSQTGETGFTIFSQTQNEIIIGRPAQVPGAGPSTYTFDNITNPSGENQVVFVRLTSHSSSDATGPFLDEGAVATTTTPDVEIYTQVPPVLIFCVATIINDPDCTDMSGNYTNVGELRNNQTAKLAVQMQARTNARSGYSIQMTGNSLASGTNTIPPITVPSPSLIGVGQFGMNLASNTNPSIGGAPVGPGINAVINPSYTTPNLFSYTSGDVLVSSTNPTRNRKFTMSYIINVPESQPIGVYTTTITYVCIGSF